MVHFDREITAFYFAIKFTYLDTATFLQQFLK